MTDFTKLSDQEKQALLDKVYELAYRYEGTYGGCTQVVLASMKEVFGIGDDTTFKAGYGFAGGSGLTGNNSCGALAGAILFIGFLTGRSVENFDGGRIEACHVAVRKVLDHFNEKYQGLRCADVQTALMGRAYQLYIPEESAAFNAAGGHDDKCTSVCADTCRFLGQMLVNGELG